MRRETDDPPGAGDPHSSRTGQREEPQEPSSEEQLGPLSFTREVKDDGRMLILYRRRDG